jgi:hypothetical protein
MGQSEASASLWRYNAHMATEVNCQASKTPRAPKCPANSGHPLTPEEVAEFMAAIEEDEFLAAPEGCAGYDPEYNG